MKKKFRFVVPKGFMSKTVYEAVLMNTKVHVTWLEGDEKRSYSYSKADAELHIKNGNWIILGD